MALFTGEESWAAILLGRVWKVARQGSDWDTGIDCVDNPGKSAIDRGSRVSEHILHVPQAGPVLDEVGGEGHRTAGAAFGCSRLLSEP